MCSAVDTHGSIEAVEKFQIAKEASFTSRKFEF
jgi:hypothetical protein